MDADRDWTPRDLITVLPRDIEFGPVSGTWASIEGLGGGLYVHKAFHSEVEAADSDLKALAS